MEPFLIIWYILMSVATFAIYAYDKRCATTGKWRIAESTLLVFTFLGGGLGAFVAMHALRHKTRHLKFKVCVPLALALQILSLAII